MGCYKNGEREARASKGKGGNEKWELNRQLGPDPGKMVKFNPGLSLILSNFRFSCLLKNM